MNVRDLINREGRRVGPRSEKKGIGGEEERDKVDGARRDSERQGGFDESGFDDVDTDFDAEDKKAWVAR